MHRYAGGMLAWSIMVVAATAPTLRADRPLGADYSHWNGTITSAQWTTLYNAGWVFGWTKATESPYDWDNDTCGGYWYTDDTLANNMVNARNAGILMGCYHFAHPQCNTAVAEANGFVDRAGDYITSGYLRPVLDLEDGYSLGATALSTWVNTFCDTVESLTGVEPIIYTNPNYAIYYLNSTVADRTLWIAEYFIPTPDPQTGEPDTGVFTTWDFWQYTASGTLPGLSGSHDLNVFNGTLAELQAYVIPGDAQPPFVVESRSGGRNYSNYSETGTWSNGSSKSSASLCTSGIGHRWCTLDSSAKTAVFTYTPTTAGVYEVFTTNCTTSNSGNPLIHRVTHTGGTTNVSVCQNTTCGTNAVNVWYSLGQYTLNANTQYRVTLDGSTGGGSSPSGNAGRSDAIKWTFVSAGAGPTITTQPTAASVCAAGTATFTIAASGSGTLSYQWQKDGTNLSNAGHYSGATTTALTVSSADSNDVASYRCVVTDSNGSATSNAAALTLKTATAITQQPTNQSVGTGGTATFTVAATGDGTLGYQWQKGGTNLSDGGHYSGTTTATLTISSADSNDAATYCCVVTGTCGSATSNGATLTVTTLTTLINDTFDGYANQAAFVAAWPTTSTSLQLSTARYYSASKSIYSPNDSTARTNKKTFTETIATDSSPITLTVRFYDPGTSGTGNQWIELRDYSPTQKQLIQFGVYSGMSTTKYSARVTYSPGSGWAATSVNRSAGWHELKVVIGSTTMNFYVDNVLASGSRAYASSEGAVSWEEMRIGSGYASAGVYANYDDVLLTKGQ
jgi:GH25 family lysozyme M1 (1,4-beta-N-acetylmuramidase)